MSSVNKTVSRRDGDAGLPVHRVPMHAGWRATALALLLFAAVTPALAEDTEARVRELERALDALSGELRALKQQLEDAKAAPKQAAAPAGGSDVPRARFGDGPQISDRDGNWSVRLSGRAQLDLRTFDPDEWLANSFSLRRARLGATVSFLKDYAARVEGEYSGSSVSLTYGYFDINWWDAARFRGGQFKRLFGLERSLSTSFNDFMERSLADSLLEGTYDRGLMVFGAPARGVNYALSATNGTGSAEKSSATAQQAQADDFTWTARLSANAAEWLALEESVLHFGGSYDVGRLGNTAAGTLKAAEAQTEARGVKFFSPDAFSGSNVDRTRYGLDAALAHGPVKLQGEWIRANYEGTSAGGTAYSRDIDGYYASLMWLVTGEHYASSYKDGVFGRIRPNAAFRSGDGWGAVELGLRYSRFDAGDFSAANAAGTGRIDAAKYSNKADAVSLGLKWIPVPNARLMLNYVRTAFDTPITVNGRTEDHEQALNLRTQIDF
jgi:phosphate-selective porin OprO and OprP